MRTTTPIDCPETRDDRSDFTSSTALSSQTVPPQPRVDSTSSTAIPASRAFPRPNTPGDRDDFMSTAPPSPRGEGMPQLPRGPPEDEGRDAFSIPEFCARHGFSPPMFYKLRKQGLTPDEISGSKVLISREAAARWRREREGAWKQPEPEETA
jgi:hypothetical protein